MTCLKQIERLTLPELQLLQYDRQGRVVAKILFLSEVVCVQLVVDVFVGDGRDILRMLASQRQSVARTVRS
jgi:hypothetical protein